MKNVKFEEMTSVSVEQYMEACNEAERYKKLYSKAVIGRAVATARGKLTREDLDFSSCLLLWLEQNALQAKTIKELEECKARFKGLREECYKISEARKAAYRYVSIKAEGKKRKIKVLQ